MCQSVTNYKLSARKTHCNARYNGPTQPSMLKGVSVHNRLDSSLQVEKEAFIRMGEKYQDQKVNPSTITSPARNLHKE